MVSDIYGLCVPICIYTQHQVARHILALRYRRLKMPLSGTAAPSQDIACKLSTFGSIYSQHPCASQAGPCRKSVTSLD